MRAECALALILTFAPRLARADGLARTADPSEHRFRMQLRAGAGVDSNVFHDARAAEQSGVIYIDAESQLEPLPSLQISFFGWFEQHLPHSDLQQTNLNLLVLYRRPLTKALTLKLGSFGDYYRQVTTFVEGTVLTHGAVFDQLAEHLAAGLTYQLGPVDFEAGVQGHLKAIRGSESFDVLGVDSSAFVRWVVNQYVSLRARYLFLFENVSGLPLRDLNGVDTHVHRDLKLQTHQFDFTARFRFAHALDLYLRYEFAATDDDFAGYLFGREHRVVTGLRYEHGRTWVVDLLGKVVDRSYPLRYGNIDNQTVDVAFEAIADAEFWFHKSWGVFARYRFDGETAEPYGLVFVRHVAVAGIGARTGITW